MTYLFSTIIALWITAAIIQLYYWLVIAWPLQYHKPKSRPVSEPVSIVICTTKLTNNLKHLVDDILNQDYPQFEIILVNDGPDLEVRQLTNEYSEAHLDLHIIDFDSTSKKTGGKKEPLAAGIAHAKYDWLLLTDSDCKVQDGWIQSMMNCASGRKRIVLGYGPLIADKGMVNAISRLDGAMIAMQYMSFAIKGRPYMGVGRNLLYHKRLYQEANGFQDHLDLASGDDDLFVQSAANKENVAINLDPASFVHSSTKTTWDDFFAQKTRHVSTSHRYPLTLKIRLGLIGLSFILMWLGGIIAALLFSPVLISLFILVAGVQWVIFTLIAKRLQSTDYVPLYPLWAMSYAIFLAIIGIIALFGRPTKSWNPS